MMTAVELRIRSSSLAAVLPLLLSCSQGAQTPFLRAGATNLGSIQIDLDVAGSPLSSVDMNVYEGDAPTGDPVITKSVALGTPPVLTAFTGALAAGDYTVTFDGTTSNGTTCSGVKSFTIVPGTIGKTDLSLVCSASFADSLPKGHYVFMIQVIPAVTCPVLENVSVAPLQASGLVTLSTQVASPAQSVGPALIVWKDGNETLASGNDGSLDCSTRSAGAHSISVTATVPGSACVSSLTTAVTCVRD